MRELEAAARRHGLGGRLNLGVIPTVAPYLLPVALTRLRAADLTRDIRVREAQTEVLLKGLDEGTLDAVVIASPAAGRGTVAEVLFQDRFLLAGSGARLAALGAGREALRPKAIDPDELLLLDEGHCLADQALEVCALDRRQTRVDLGASSLSTLCGLVAEGFGLTFLPELAVRTETAAAAEMRLVRFAAPEPAREVRLVRRESASDAGWFADLARILTEAGADLLAHARRLV
jgi:LysR family hydrogen peroxide-inducible transcriptional activator